MNHTAFFDSVKRGQIARVYLFYGEESYIQRKALQALEKAILPPGLEVLNETLLEACSVQSIIDAAETLPVFSDRRLVIVHDFQPLVAPRAQGEEEAEKLAAYLQNTPEESVIVLACSKPPDKRRKAFLALAKAAVTVTFDALDDAELSRWVAQQLKPYGQQMEKQDALYLAFWTGRELNTLRWELEKLSASAEKGQRITQEDIENLATRSPECTIFALLDALSDGKRQEAFVLTKTLLSSGENRIGILAMLARQVRQTLECRLYLDDGMRENEIQKRMGVKPYPFGRIVQKARTTDAKTLQEQLTLCVDTDYNIKNGHLREEIALERVLLRM